MKIIRNFVINTTDLHAASSTRTFSVNGDVGANFTLYVRNEDPKFYNFVSDAFQTAETSETKLHNVEIPSSGRYQGKIIFPTITDDDKYDIQLITNPAKETQLDASISSNGIILTKTIEQKVDSTVTFAVATTTSGDFQTMPSSVTLVKPPNDTSKQTSEISWTIKAVDAITGGGLEIKRQPLETDFKFTTTPESIGSGSSATVIYLNSVDNLTTGMSLTTIESGSVSGSPTISSIDETGKSVTVSVAQSWSTAKDITFKDGGTSAILDATGANIKFTDLSVALTPFTATVTPAISSATDIVCSTSYGIRVGATYTGIGVNNETTQYVTGTAYGSNSFSTTSAQTLKNNTILTFDGCSQEATIKATVTTTKMPENNLTLTLDLDSVLDSALT